jgi:hypothetical protein
MQKSRGGLGQARLAVATRTAAGHDPLFQCASSAGAWQSCLKTRHRPAHESPTAIDAGATSSALKLHAPRRMPPATSTPNITLRTTAPPPSPPSAPPRRPALSCGGRARAWISTPRGRWALPTKTAPMPRPPGLAALALAIAPPCMLPLGWSMPPAARHVFASFGLGRSQPPQHSKAPPRLAPPTSAPAPADPSPPHWRVERAQNRVERVAATVASLHGPKASPPARNAPQASKTQPRKKSLDKITASLVIGTPPDNHPPELKKNHQTQKNRPPPA